MNRSRRAFFRNRTALAGLVLVGAVVLAAINTLMDAEGEGDIGVKTVSQERGLGVNGFAQCRHSEAEGSQHD